MPPFLNDSFLGTIVTDTQRGSRAFVHNRFRLDLTEDSNESLSWLPPAIVRGAEHPRLRATGHAYARFTE